MLISRIPEGAEILGKRMFASSMNVIRPDADTGIAIQFKHDDKEFIILNV